MAARRGVKMALERVFLCAILSLICLQATPVVSQQPWETTTWADAHATFYGGQDASGTMSGACGYGNLYNLGYGIATAALSSALFNDGLTCGACFQLMCKLDQTKWCYPGGRSITITATNYCPQGSFDGWCDSPKRHFDLSYPMFATLAQKVGGVIPVNYRRVSCQKQGGIRFTVNGNPWFVLTLVWNVGGGGDIKGLSIRGTHTNWYTAIHNWGVNWETSQHPDLANQQLSFKVTLGSGKFQEFDNVSPTYWRFGQTFEGNSNFYSL